jgi:hypothetical protein
VFLTDHGGRYTLAVLRDCYHSVVGLETPMKTSSVLTVGKVYSRVELADRFGITDATLNTGIFQPPGHESVCLFVTEKKTPDRTQYRDHLDGDDLSWDGQTSGRKDAVIIGHEAEGLELLLFYRKSKTEFDNYGFRYEGAFRYVSHRGSKPAHFLLRRVGAPGLGPVLLRTVTDAHEVGTSLANFNRQASVNPDRARSVLRQTTYWVFHPNTGMFGPGKFVGYADMDFEGYERANAGHSEGARFDGHVSKEAVEYALSAEFGPDPELHEPLRRWGTQLLGPDGFGNANPAKWQFVVLDGDIRGGVGADVDESVVEALERSQARGQGFLLDSKLRKALEDYAMDSAKRYFEAEGYECEDRSKTCPYDLRCSLGHEVLHVEVKGTQTDGGEIILTPGEVEFARGHKGRMALFVLHSIQVSEGDDGFMLTGGEHHLIQPWDVDLGKLVPVSFRYALPDGKP